MDDLIYSKIYSEAKSYILKNGLRNDADDFAQYCCLYSFENGKRSFFEIYPRSRLNRFVRTNYGAKGSTRKNAKFIELNENLDYLKTHDDSWIEVKDHLSLLSRYERLLYVMYHQHDFNFELLGQAVGILGSSVAEQITEIQKKIDYFLKYKKGTALKRFLGDLSKNGEHFDAKNDDGNF